MDYSYPARKLSPEPGSETDDTEILTPTGGPVQEHRGDNETASQAILSEEEASDRKISVLGRTLVFKGELSAGEDLLIQGRVEGSIKHTATNLTIGSNGVVRAEIDAQRVLVHGDVRGNIRGSDTVTIEPSARVQGNIYAPSVSLKEGAKFKGSIDMDFEPTQASGAQSSKSSSADKSNAKARSTKKSELNESNVDDLLDQSDS